MEKQVNILLIEDDDVDAEVVRKALKSLEANIVHAKSGTEGLGELAKRSDFGLILLDYRLPDLDGMEMIAQIKKIDPKAPIVVVTGYGDEETVKATVQAGVLDYIPKNRITPEFLTRTILNDLLIHRTQLEKVEMERRLEAQRDRDIQTLSKIIEMAKEKIAEYDK
jgi:DNA-binding NtrC family response regulator